MLPKILRYRALITAIIILLTFIFVFDPPMVVVMFVGAVLGWTSGDIDYNFPYKG